MHNILFAMYLCRNCYTTFMDVVKMIAELRVEREQITDAIAALERLSERNRKRRGRPPSWLAINESERKRRGRPPGIKNKPKEQLGN